jgi:hypothetical protein
MEEIQEWIIKYLPRCKNSMLVGNGEISISEADGYEIRRLMDIANDNSVAVQLSDGRLRFKKIPY